MGGHAGGVGGKHILKSDGERSIKALRDAIGHFHGGEIIIENQHEENHNQMARLKMLESWYGNSPEYSKIKWR